MFGIVPRVLWERVCPPDELNRVRLNMNCLFIETPDERILVETGIGEKWSDKESKMYGIYRQKPFAGSLLEITGCRPGDISIVINTHLHFDHAGGNTVFGQHFSFAMPGVPWCEFFVGSDPGVPLDQGWRYPGQSVPEDGYITPNDAPGFGLEIDPAWIEPF